VVLAATLIDEGSHDARHVEELEHDLAVLAE
jgi:hypothetical protein